MRGMLGLLRNYAHLMMKNAMIWGGIWLVLLMGALLHFFGVAQAEVLDSYFVGMTLMLIPIVSLETVNKALMGGWDVFMKAMPIRKSVIVASYYVSYILLSLIALAIVLVLPFGAQTGIMDLMRAAVIAHLVCIVFLPLAYALIAIAPDANGQFTIFIAAVAAMVAGSLGFPRIATDYTALPIGIGIIAAGYAVSIVLSVYFDKLGRRGVGRRAAGSLHEVV